MCAIVCMRTCAVFSCVILSRVVLSYFVQHIGFTCKERFYINKIANAIEPYTQQTPLIRVCWVHGKGTCTLIACGQGMEAPIVSSEASIKKVTKTISPYQENLHTSWIYNKEQPSLFSSDYLLSWFSIRMGLIASFLHFQFIYRPIKRFAQPMAWITYKLDFF